jgi:hypothetical protein
VGKIGSKGRADAHACEVPANRKEHMQFDSSLNATRPVAALLGNGELATTLGRSGYHDSEPESDAVGAAQEFVLAGRRLPGARHELVSFGRLTRRISFKGTELEMVDSHQSIHTDSAELRTRVLYSSVLESSRSMILAHRNCFVVETRVTSQTTEDLSGTLQVSYHLPPGLASTVALHGSVATVSWEAGNDLGVTTLSAQDGAWEQVDGALVLTLERNLAPGDELFLELVVSFSDRISFQEPLFAGAVEGDLHSHAEWWRDFWGRSEIVTGDEQVDAFREMSLYTIACQATPWSIPPTLSKRYWDGGAFHDEYYPYRALLAGGWTDIARRIPYFRLTTLPQAVERAKGEGALYPWSSTEDGLERDPHGHWYSERFHLGLIAACAWVYWLYERDIDDLEELYPVIKGCARYFAVQMLERDERGALRTKPCTDFDESAGAVSGGPFTMAAAVYLFDHSAEAARRLAKSRGRTQEFERLGKELRNNIPVDLQERRYCVPSSEQHSSLLASIVPFFLDEGSEFARNSLDFIQEQCRTELGWKPGLNKAFDGTTWIWTAGHLGMCHTVLGDGVGAWEAVKRGPLATGQFMSPNEHLDVNGSPVVPWFTTGCGAWLAALHWMFARVDDNGDHLLPAVPPEMADWQIRGLRLSRGVSVAARCETGKLVYLSFTAREAVTFSFEGPVHYLEGVWPKGAGRIVDLGDRLRIQVDLSSGENVFIE